MRKPWRSDWSHIMNKPLPWLGITRRPVFGRGSMPAKSLVKYGRAFSESLNNQNKRTPYWAKSLDAKLYFSVWLWNNNKCKVTKISIDLLEKLPHWVAFGWTWVWFTALWIRPLGCMLPAGGFKVGLAVCTNTFVCRKRLMLLGTIFWYVSDRRYKANWIRRQNVAQIHLSSCITFDRSSRACAASAGQHYWDGFAISLYLCTCSLILLPVLNVSQYLTQHGLVHGIFLIETCHANHQHKENPIAISARK